MNHKQRRTLHALFAHPVSGNINSALAYSMLEALGAEVSHGGHGHIVVKLKGRTHGFRDSHHTFSKDGVAKLRKFLGEAGIDPARDFPLDGSAA